MAIQVGSSHTNCSTNPGGIEAAAYFGVALEADGAAGSLADCRISLL